MDTFDEALKRYHAAQRELVKGNPRPVIETFSQREDVVLCNPLRPVARGSSEVAETVEQAASHVADGEYEPETITTFATSELGYSVEIERVSATVNGNEASFSLRVTTIFRLEDDGWRVAHRHADPITTPRPFESVLQA